MKSNVINKQAFKQSIRPYMMVFPVMVFIGGIFLLGIVFGLLQSFGYFPIIGMKEFTLKYYGEILWNKQFIEALKFSLYTAFVSSAISVGVGVMLAYLLLKTRGERAYKLCQIPVMVPHTVAALMVFILLTQSGIIPRVFYNLGFISDMNQFPELIFDRTGFGVILSYLWKGAPFMTMVTYNVLQKIDEKYTGIAQNLGANNWQIMLHILMPLLFPSIASGFIIIFAFSFGAFEIPYLLGASTPKALPVLSYVHYNSINLSEKPLAMAINMCITLCALAMVGLYFMTLKKMQKYNID